MAVGEPALETVVRRRSDGLTSSTGHQVAGDENWEVTRAETDLYTAIAAVGESGDDITTDRFMFTYGDGIRFVDMTALLEFHRETGCLGTVTGVHPTSRHGEMLLKGGHVAELNEKSTVPEGLVSGGFFVFERLQKLARHRQLAVFSHEASWMDMDTCRNYDTRDDLWATGDAPWKVWDD